MFFLINIKLLCIQHCRMVSLIKYLIFIWYNFSVEFYSNFLFKVILAFKSLLRIGLKKKYFIR